MNLNDQNIKEKIYRNKTYSEKNIVEGGKEKIQTIQLLNLLEKGIPQNLKAFLEKKDHPSPQILDQGIISLIKNYQKGDQKFYDLLSLLLSYGASIDIPIIYNGIKESDNVTLLMFGIQNNDLYLINLVLNFNPNIDKTDSRGRNAIIYAVIYDNKDSTDIIEKLINEKANINYALKIQMSEEPYYEFHSVLTLSIFKDLINITKCLLDNNVDVNFRTEPKGDTGLHIAAQYAGAKLFELLLYSPKMLGYIEIKNKEGKTPIELIRDKDIEKNEKIQIFNNYYKKFKNVRNQNLKMFYSDMNNKFQQINHQMQLNKLHEFSNNNYQNMKNFGDVKLLNMNNSPQSRYNYTPQEINKNGDNQLILNNNLNILNNLVDNNSINPNIMQNNFNNDLNPKNNNFIIDVNEKASQIQNLNNNINNNNYLNKNKNEIDQNINKENDKDTIQKYPIEQYINPIYNNNYHKSQNISYINSYKLLQIKNKFNNKLLNKKDVNYNVEIPIEFIKNKHKNFNNDTNINTNGNIYEINNFIKQNNIPILNFYLSNK